MSKAVKILITGDTHLGSGRIVEPALKNSTERLFGSFKSKIEEVDLSITNLESPLIDKGDPIPKTGPNLKSPVKAVEILKDAGFDLLTLANNHILDYGGEGLTSTFEACKKNKIKTVGAGKNKNEASQPFTQVIGDIRIGIINVAENEFGTTNNDSPGAHSLNPVQNYYRIKEISNVDYIFVIVHGGHEYYPLPSPRMKETYRFFIDAGASAVIGHHPHCYSGYEIYKNAPIFYSLGNFLFDKNKGGISSWNKGYMVEFSISKRELDFDIIPYIQNAENIGLRTLKNDEQLQFDKDLSELNDIIVDQEKLGAKFKEYCESSRKLYNAYIEPHSVRFVHALRNRNLFPSFLSDRKKRLLLNLTRCEAHRDVLQKILQG